MRIPYLHVSYEASLLDQAAVKMLSLMGKNPLSEQLVIRGVDRESPHIKLKSLLTYGERARKFGISGRHFKSAEELDRAIEGIIRCYGDLCLTSRWTLPTTGLGSAVTPLQVSTWLNKKAAEFQDFCTKGDYEPIQIQR